MHEGQGEFCFGLSGFPLFKKMSEITECSHVQGKKSIKRKYNTEKAQQQDHSRICQKEQQI